MGHPVLKMSTWFYGQFYHTNTQIINKKSTCSVVWLNFENAFSDKFLMKPKVLHDQIAYSIDLLNFICNVPS